MAGQDAVIFEQVKLILSDVLARTPESIRPESSLPLDLDADSLDIVEIGIQVEAAFGMKLSDDLREYTDTVGALVAAIAAADPGAD